MQTNLTQYFKERNFEKKYGLLLSVICSALLVALIIALYK